MIIKNIPLCNTKKWNKWCTVLKIWSN